MVKRYRDIYQEMCLLSNPLANNNNNNNNNNKNIVWLSDVWPQNNIPFIGVGFYRQECPISGVLRHFLTLVSCSLNFTCASIIHNDSNPSLNLHSLCVFNLWKKELVPLNSSPPHLKPRCSSIPYSFVFLFSSRQW